MNECELADFIFYIIFSMFQHKVQNTINFGPSLSVCMRKGEGKKILFTTEMGSNVSILGRHFPNIFILYTGDLTDGLVMKNCNHIYLSIFVL